MLRLLTIITILSSSLLFANQIEKKLEDFFTATLGEYNIEEFKITNIKELDYPKGWSAYFISLKYNVKNREILIDDIIFSDNVSISRDFTNIENKKSLKKELFENYKNSTKENK